MSESVAVVVVTFNRADLLGGMLDGLAAQTHEPDAVIVVDNASADHTREVLDAHRGLTLQRIHKSIVVFFAPQFWVENVVVNDIVAVRTPWLGLKIGRTITITNP